MDIVALDEINYSNLKVTIGSKRRSVTNASCLQARSIAGAATVSVIVGRTMRPAESNRPVPNDDTYETCTSRRRYICTPPKILGHNIRLIGFEDKIFGGFQLSFSAMFDRPFHYQFSVKCFE